MDKIIVLLLCSTIPLATFAQNVGIGLEAAAGKLHIKGSANSSQLIIDAHSTQSSSNPLIRFRNSTGLDLMWLHADDTTNAFIGFKAGRVNVVGPQGIHNTFIGGRAGYSNTNGRDNTAIGNNALFSNEKASLNTAIGTNALYSQSFSPGGAWWQSKNVAIGYESLYSNQPTNGGNGQSNTAVGTSSMYSNTIGKENVAMGAYALYLNTTGSSNIAIGTLALYSSINGVNNVAVGYKALFLANGDNNCAFGTQALEVATTGANNSAFGYQSLSHHTTGFNNTAIGESSLHNNTNASSNTAIGSKALYSNTTGQYNTATGHLSLQINSTGSSNTAIGYNSLNYNYTGYNNMAAGSLALSFNTTGHSNTAVGQGALLLNYTGSSNTAVGTGSGNDLDNLSNNTIIGADAHVGLVSSNCVAVGYGAFTNVANVALFGNTTSGPIGGYDPWTIFSDGRFKTGVNEDVIGLDFILRLRPVTYHMDIRALHEFWGISDYGRDEDSIATETKALIDDAISKKESIAKSGFIAQEVEEAALESGYNFSGLVRPAHEQDHYRIGYAEFVVPLVKAVQELSEINRNQARINESLTTENKELTQRIEKLEAFMDQNSSFRQ